MFSGRVVVGIEGRTVKLRAWQYDIVGSSGYTVPVLLLDADVSDNRSEDRRITDHLYGGDDQYRLMQEIVLGVGGVRLLQAAGCTGLQTFHLNEGHAALAPLELLRAEDQTDGVTLSVQTGSRSVPAYTFHRRSSPNRTARR